MTIVWIVGITNAFNLVDGLDGLAAGVAFFAVMIIPDTVRTTFQDNPIGGLAMYLAGPLWARIAFRGFVAIVGTLMLAGAVELAFVRGKLRSAWWRLAMAGGFLVSGAAFLVHEQNPWFFQRSAFLHHTLGWTLVAAAIFPLLRCVRPRSRAAA